MRDIYFGVKNWSVETFGDEVEKGPTGPLKHLKKECDEALADPYDITEYADLLILVMDASWRAGFSLRQLREATLNKIEVLKTREYARVPDGEISEHNRALD
jgi:hypothetical protein